MQSNDKAMMKATLLGKVNSKIQTGEGTSMHAPLCMYLCVPLCAHIQAHTYTFCSLIGIFWWEKSKKRFFEIKTYAVCIVTSYLAMLVTGM